MDPMLFMMLCSTLEAGAAIVTGLSLVVLAIIEVRREIRGRRPNRRYRLKGTNKQGTW